MTIDLKLSLQSKFGFSSFRHGQVEAIHSLLDGMNTLVVMPTGSGKSLIFQLSALQLPGVTLVISPLIALMKDQVDSLVRRGISATFINSTLTGGEQNHRLKDLSAGKYHLVYVAPERLRSSHFLNSLKGQNVSLLAIDEAHCISEWGHDFRPDYLHIAQFRKAIGSPLTAALTATATPQVQEDITRLLGLLEAQRIVTGFNRPNLAFEVRYITGESARLRALQELLTNQQEGGTIIYTGTRREAEEVAEFVGTVVGIKARHYHAGLPSEARSYIQDEFMSGDLPVVVATNAFGMGIDRPDVRQVIHYSLPGSLEAYYQEAGRAGRDELPARAVLLYSPEDRALQEWFIENGTLSPQDLRLLFDTLRPGSNGQVSITIDDLSRLTGLQEVKVRVGLAELERAGMIERLGDEGLRILLQLQSWKIPEIQAVTDRLKQHQQHRKAQLERMIFYAETNTCRRMVILNHFGDPGDAEAEVCCDNCQARRITPSSTNNVDTLTQSDRVPLAVLDTVRRLKRNVGCEKIAQILKGSRAQDILHFGYDKSPYYGRLAVFTLAQIKAVIDQLLELGYLKMIGGDYPVLHLTPQGEVAIRNKTTIQIKLPRQIDVGKIERKKAERQAGGTLEYTAQLLAEGLGVDQIANSRGLSINTIYSHLAKLIAAGRVSVAVVIAEELLQEIEAAIHQVGSVEFLTPIKVLLPEEIDYNIIRCVVEGWKREHAPNTQSAPAVTPLPPVSTSADPIAIFLSSSHPRQLPGSWNAGWALGFHSQFTGSDWSRSEVGNLTYRLKYQGDLTALPKLVDHAAALMVEHPELAEVDAIIPVPPSTPHMNELVTSFAQTLADRLGLPVAQVLIKSRLTTPQKELHTLAQKNANVAGAFDLQSPVKGKSLLVVDDLFDSGATLEEITRILHHAGASRVCVLTLTRTIHSDP